ncbi:hypothetical protein [Streptomyces stelliscabiei]|uniref:hypothetical protein n=1 Tax=Streptomyces stelliscabiei TaxID=146820 RepID=UPI0029BDE717|nr:hypothetical protein [Streptomyces stelliscabiei]MDX2557266.1 hypothetical protein [Streptomyces stelliscabiei]MDX2616344.1 hypothetical protein [Streptomyces stelliscabiei]MDX2641045.1 hypothetical protein [Streptomyces stelliscabiei]MDX2665107.1 hypothetical protein [Streptomyces stelliscabiei]MDX2716218.1 hypothetical protein [Streptomyces stelliscabiei]
MNYEQHQDGEQYERITLSTGAGKTEGFAAIMQRLKGRSADERAALRAQAEAAVLGHEAYALGHEYLERGDYVAAKRWLRVAAAHDVPGAEQALEEIDSGQIPDGGPESADGTDSAAGVSCEPSSAEGGVCVVVDEAVPYKEVQPHWTVLLEHVYTGDIAAAAQAEARRGRERVGRAADEAGRRFRKQMRQDLAEFRRSLATHRRKIAELLAESEHVLTAAQEVLAKARHAAEALQEEAEQRAEAIIGDAYRSAVHRDQEKVRAEAADAGYWLAWETPESDAEEDWQLLLCALHDAYRTAVEQWPVVVEGTSEVQVWKVWKALRQPGAPDGSPPGTAAVMRAESLDESAAVGFWRSQGIGSRAPARVVRALIVSSEAVHPGTPLSLTGRFDLRGLDRCLVTTSEPHERKRVVMLWCCNLDHDEDPENSHVCAAQEVGREEDVRTFRYIGVEQDGNAGSSNPAEKTALGRRILAPGTAADW